MSARKKSVESFNEFFDETKTDNENEEKKPSEEVENNDVSPSAAIANLIKTQPVIHHPQTASDLSNKNSETIPSIINAIDQTRASLSPRSKYIDSPQSKPYESDFDDDKEQKNTDRSLVSKKKTNPTLTTKQPSFEMSHQINFSRLKPSHTVTPATTNTTNNSKMRRKERFLPKIHPPKTRKVIQKLYKKDNRTEIEKRLSSAKNHQVNKLQSYIAEVSRQLEEERIENRTLRLIQHREEKELKKYTAEEEDLLLVLRDYSKDIQEVKEQISIERESKWKLENEIKHRDRALNDKAKRIKVYKKLISEQDLDETEELRARLKEANKKLKQHEDEFSNQENRIEKLEKNYHHEIKQELLKKRELKREIDQNSKKYTDLLLKFEDKTRQVDTMHIYIQRGGRRPSHSSANLLKSLSLQSLEEESPRFREKALEYDKKRREQLKHEFKLKPKPKPQLLPDKNPPPKRERIKYIPKIEPKPQIKKPTPVISHVKNDERLPAIHNEPLPVRVKTPVRRLSTPRSIDEDRSELDDETISDFIRLKPPSAPSKIIQRGEQHLSQSQVRKRSLTPNSPPFEMKYTPSTSSQSTTKSNLLKNTQPIILSKPSVKHELDDTWSNLFDNNKKDQSKKDDLLSKLMSDEEQENRSTTKLAAPSGQRPSLIMFDSSTSSTNGHQKKLPPARTTVTNIFDFDQAVNNLHDGVPVTTPSKSKRSDDPFDSFFKTNKTKSTNHMNGRDDTFTTTSEKSDPLDLPLDAAAVSAATVSSTIKTNSKHYPSKNDKLQRPKVISNAPKPIPNRTVVEEIEEFFV